MNRIRVAILYGGRSGEHEVSLTSARSIVEALDRRKYELILVGIDPQGRWHRHSEEEFRSLTTAPLPRVAHQGRDVVLVPAPSPPAATGGRRDQLNSARVDVVFPVLHGPFGEDGTVQGLLELADLPYVGAGVLGSALGMDKDVQKRLLREAGLPVVDYVAVHRGVWDDDRNGTRSRVLQVGLPLFVKPANLGSSVGVSKVKTAAELDAAVATAFEYDDKIVIERGLSAREIECAVLGNETPEASVPGEVMPQAEFYSYEAKYVNADGATFAIPAPLPEDLTETIQRMAVRAFQTLECAGMARVDFFLEHGSDALYVNEINTIPGFTPISQYPRLWAASGLPYPELIDRLVQLALERQERKRHRRTAYLPPEPAA